MPYRSVHKFVCLGVMTLFCFWVMIRRCEGFLFSWEFFRNLNFFGKFSSKKYFVFVAGAALSLRQMGSCWNEARLCFDVLFLLILQISESFSEKLFFPVESQSKMSFFWRCICFSVKLTEQLPPRVAEIAMENIFNNITVSALQH